MEFLEFIDQWAWVAWLGLIAVFLVIEMFTFEFTFLMLALGGGAGLISSFANAPFWMQVVIAAIVATLLILFLRPPLLKRLQRSGDPTKSNVEALIGLRGHVLQTVTSASGQVKLSNGDTWTARSGTNQSLPPQTPIAVIAISGAIAVVTPLEGYVSQ